MQTDEERRARCRAYYELNKCKWKKYKQDRLARMSEEERQEHDRKQREYSKLRYRKNKARKKEQVRAYRRRRADWFRAYQAAWYRANRGKVAARRREHYHAVVKPRLAEEKAAAAAESPNVTVRRAAELLGVELSVLRRWVYSGRIASSRTLGGHYRLRRSDVSAIVINLEHIPADIKERLGLGGRGGAK